MTSLDAAEARRRFAAARVARLATVSGDGRPHLVPVTFALEGDTLCFAVDHKPKSGRELRRLRNIRENERVCLLADHYSDDWEALWWARADGTAGIVDQGAGEGTGDTGASRRADAVRLLVARYPQYAERPPEGPLVLVAVERWSGWSYR